MKILGAIVLLAIAAGVVVRGGAGIAARPTARIPASELAATISHGAAVDLEEQLEGGQWTLLEFGADW